MALDFTTHINKALAVIGVLFGAVLVLSAAASVAPQFFAQTAATNEVLANETISTGDATADSLKPIFSLIFGIVALVAFVGIIVAAVTIRNNGD